MRKALPLGAGMLIVFITAVAILMRVIPGPRKETDYLVIGTLATFAALMLLFVVLVTSIFKDPSALFRRKKS
ncbi:MAG: hypothetical protein IT163_02875 [Bryobacterales bacterium]|nr:hypothetical protein [Bryobacterales bacterium]